MLNAPVGVRRAIARVLPARLGPAERSVRFHRRITDPARDLGIRAQSVAATAQQAPARVARAAASPIAPVRERLGPEAALPFAVALIVAVASILSWLPGLPARGAVGGTISDADGPRVGVGGAIRSFGEGELIRIPPNPANAKADTLPALDGPGIDYRRIDPDAAAAAHDAAAAEPGLGGPFGADGTFMKPIAVTTTLADGKDLLDSYQVRRGDTLPAIAKRFGVSTMTLVWANGLTSMRMRIGSTLRIPPFNGVVITVKEGDTLDGLAKRYSIDADRIYEINGLEDRVLIAGQTLVLAGAKGDPLPVAKPPGSQASSGGGGTVRPPATYAGGAMAWPVVGGNNYVSQPYRAGHYGLDIAADHGARVRAAAGGTVTFAGWKSNGGGYQVWIAHGSGLHTTYNHMSGVSVGVGQRVGKGQQVGRVGASGLATGPHLHFEVWRGPIWNGGTRVNPLAYL